LKPRIPKNVKPFLKLAPGVLVVALVSGLLWWRLQRPPLADSMRRDLPTQSAPAVRGASSASVPAMPVAAVATIVPVPVAASAAPVDASCTLEPREAIETRRAADDADDGDDDPAEPAGPRHSAAFIAARQRILGAMRAGPDAYARAVAVWLDPAATPEAARQRQLSLADMARTMSDPRIYALAFRTCGTRGPNDGCQTLSVRRWAALDPGNATPWLYALDDAVRAADMSGQEEALFHVANSDRFDDRFHAPIGPIVDTAGTEGAEPAAAYALAVDAIGLSAAQISHELTLSQLCRSSAPTDANRQQLCGAAARLLAEHSDTLLGHMLGVSLDARLTGDTSRLDRMRAAPPDPIFKELDDPGSCAQLRHGLQVLRRLATVGETGLVRERQAASAAPAH
jgi:hypothetical protein